MIKRMVSIAMVMVFTLLSVSGSAEASKRKSAGKVRSSRTSSTAVTIPATASGISIKTFCKPEYLNKECGKIIALLDSETILGGLRKAGFEVVSTETESRDADYTGEEPDYYTAYIYKLQRVSEKMSATVYVDSDYKVTIEFPTLEEMTQFIVGCKKFGYKHNEWNGDDSYRDTAKCHYAGSALEVDNDDLRVIIEAVWEP